MYIRREPMADRRRGVLTDDERKARMVEAEYWHVLRTARNKVDDARYFLEDMGVAVAQPIANRWRRAGRGWKIRHVPVRAQAFDGYLFIGVRGRGVMWSALHETGYFRAVVCVDGRPVRLTGADVQLEMFRADTGRYDDPHPAERMASTLKQGDRVKLRDHGAFTGCDGPIDEVGELTAKVLLTICGKATPCEVALDQLELIEEKGA